MSQVDWKKLQEIFEKAILIPKEEHEKYLDAACLNDAEMLKTVKKLLNADAKNAALEEDPYSIKLKSIDSQLTGSTIDGWEIKEQIGTGGMGTVFYAEKTSDGFQQQVAFKIVKKGMDSEIIVNRFRQERQILASLDHPNIARLIDGGVTNDGRLYFVMELVRGLPIDEYCDSHRLNIPHRLALFQKACNAVHYAHTNLIVHRDLKPSNIIVTDRGDLKLLDFGIAKLLDDSENTQLTRTGMQLHTPAYASPEQLLGELITTASDIYALGILFYEILSGRRPFELKRSQKEFVELILTKEPMKPSEALSEELEFSGTNQTETIEDISSKRGERTERLRRKLSGDLDVICLTAMHREPERRYTSASELATDIKRHLDGLPVLARADSAYYRLQKLVKRNIPSTIISVTAVATIITLSVFYTIQLTKQKENALQESAVSNEVVEFMVETFQAANPSYHQGKDFNAELLLDAATKKIEQLERSSIVKARLLLTLGRSYENMGIFDKAFPIIVQSVKLTSEEEIIDHRVIAKSLLFLGELQYEANDSTSSIVSLTKSIKHYEQLLSENETPNKEDELGKSLALSSLAIAVGDLDQLDKSEKLTLKALAIVIKYYGEESFQAAVIYNNLGHIYRHRSELTQAKQILIKGLKAFRASSGPLDLNLAHNLNQLSRTMSLLQEYEEALPLAQEGLTIRRKIYKRDHFEIAASLGVVSNILAKLNKLEEAEKTRSESLIIFTNLFGETHRYIAATLNSLGQLLYQQGKTDQAKQNFEKALAMLYKMLPANNARIAFPLVSLGKLSLDKKNYDQARAYLEKAYSIRKKSLEKNHWRTAEAGELLAKVFEQQKKHSKAEELILAAYNTKLISFGKEDQRVQRMKKDWPQYLFEK